VCARPQIDCEDLDILLIAGRDCWSSATVPKEVPVGWQKRLGRRIAPQIQAHAPLLSLPNNRESSQMTAQLNGNGYETDSVIAFAPQAEHDPSDQLDQAGQTILQLLHRAAGVAEDNSRHALETAQKLADQLRVAQDRIVQLEAEIESSRDRADRAEQWL